MKRTDRIIIVLVDEQFAVPLITGSLCRRYLALCAVLKLVSEALHSKNVAKFSLILTTAEDSTAYFCHSFKPEICNDTQHFA